MKVILLIVLLFCAGCATVSFQQKELLADRMMSFDASPVDNEMRGHMILPREGSIGGFSSVGAGGCSCK